MVGVDVFPIEIVPFRGRSLVFGGVHQLTVSVVYRHFKAQLEYDRTGPIRTQGSTCHMRHGLPSPRCKMAVSKNKGTPKWMGKIMENPIKMDDLFLGNTQIQGINVGLRALCTRQVA